MKLVDVKSGVHIDYGVYLNNDEPTFKIGDHVRITKYKNIFA